jgi:hypothetical protein
MRIRVGLAMHFSNSVRAGLAGRLFRFTVGGSCTGGLGQHYLVSRGKSDQGQLQGLGSLVDELQFRR